MQRLLSYCKLALACLGLLATLLVFPGTFSWGAISAPEPLAAGQPHPLWAQAVDIRFNLYRMQPGLYRSALPGEADQPRLAQLGITTVINFYQRTDAQWLNDPQVHQVHLPLRTDRIDDADVLQVLRSIRQAQAQGPVLIHCKHGQNRTGLIAAMYRIVYQGWSKAQALDEMRNGGFGGVERMDDAERYVQEVDLKRLQAALDSGACSTSPWALCAVKARLVNVLNE